MVKVSSDVALKPVHSLAVPREGSLNGRSVVVVDDTNRYDFLAGMGPINIDFLAIGAVVGTVAATVAVGIATQSLKSTGITFAICVAAFVVINAATSKK